MAQFRQSFSEPPDSSGSRNQRERETPPKPPVVLRAPSSGDFEALLAEITQQALLTTRATGAAIALSQGGQMVCRATTGGHAPELGAEFDMKSGLSGACVQTRRVQICTDTELDPRVNVEACRALGVRSILVAPLLQQDVLIGVMELFSPIVRSFGERDIQTLEACTRRILDAMEKANEPRHAANPPEPKPVSPSFEPPPSLLAQIAAEPEPKRRDFTTTVLTGLVIGLAILFGSLLGLRIERQRLAQLQIRARTAGAGQAPASTPAPVEDKTPPLSTEPTVHPQGGVVSPARKTEKANDHAGGLVVYQNDRVVFQIPPGKGEAASGSSTESAETVANGTEPLKLSSEVAGQLLASRVDPQYPPEALAARIQGTVGVRLVVDRTGSVRLARVLSGPPELAQAAVDAVKQWRFRPYAANGAAEDFQTTATIDFRLP